MARFVKASAVDDGGRGEKLLPRTRRSFLMRILLVEDSDALRNLFARMLKRRGFEVREAADGWSALECLAEFRPELILTDIMMPGLDGFGLIRHLRAMPEMAGVPVVVMTAGDPG